MGLADVQPTLAIAKPEAEAETDDSPAAPNKEHGSEDDQAVAHIDPREERAFVWRLDLFFMSIGFIGYMFKYLDQGNISNAYVSGMQTDLKLYGNELNYFTTFFNVGYIIMLVPSIIIVSHIGPSVWLPACEVIWGILTCCLSTVQSKEQVYGLRFLIGLFEATAWPAYITVISQWYLPREIATRMALYNMAQPSGAILSGATQGALATNLSGVLGRAGWRWAFIINGISTIAVASLAFFALPGYPERPNPLSKVWLKPRHIEIAKARIRRVGRRPQLGISFKDFVRCLTFWQTWAFSLTWPLACNIIPTLFFNLYLRSLRNPDGTRTYSVAMLNYIPMIGHAVQIVAEFVFGRASDYFRSRLPFLLLHSVINVISLVILIISPANRGLHFAGYFLNHVAAVPAILLLAWAAENLEDEPQVRTFIFASGTIIAYVMAAFIPIGVYPAKEAPNWKIGPKLYLGFTLISTVMFVAIYYRLRWQAKHDGGVVVPRQTEDGVDSETGSQVRSGAAKTARD